VLCSHLGWHLSIAILSCNTGDRSKPVDSEYVATRPDQAILGLVMTPLIYVIKQTLWFVFTILPR